ncbi:hypothetical protein, partial [Pseudomonas aeruginosa]
AFANQIRLFDAAVQAVAELDAAEELHPLAARVRLERQRLEAQGPAPAEARPPARRRGGGAPPGASGPRRPG